MLVGSLWISSINSTSRGCRFVRIAARSPVRTIIGPAVTLSPTPISCATMCASVVFPSPGGPVNRTWSSASSRALAAFRKTLRFSRTFVWPMNSSSLQGRSFGSTAASSSSADGESTERVLSFTSGPRQSGKRFLEELRERRRRAAARQRVDHPVRLRFLVAEIDESRDHVARQGNDLIGLERGGKLARLFLELECQSIGRLLADPGNRRQPPRVPARE